MIDSMSAEAICSGKLVIAGRCLLASQFTLGPQCKRPDALLKAMRRDLPPERTDAGADGRSLHEPHSARIAG